MANLAANAAQHATARSAETTGIALQHKVLGPHGPRVLAQMDSTCRYCGSQMWLQERVRSTALQKPRRTEITMMPAIAACTQHLSSAAVPLARSRLHTASGPLSCHEHQRNGLALRYPGLLSPAPLSTKCLSTKSAWTRPESTASPLTVRSPQLSTDPPQQMRSPPPPTGDPSLFRKKRP